MCEKDTSFFFFYSYLAQPPPFSHLHAIKAGILCQRCSSGTTLPHLFSCSFRLQGSCPSFEAPPLPLSLQCTLVINFVLLLFVPVTRSPLFWASSPWSTRLEVFFFCEPWQLPNWMMNVPLFLCNWTASSLIGLEDAPPPSPPTPYPGLFHPPTPRLTHTLPPPLHIMFTLRVFACLSLSGCLPSLPIHLSNNI